MLITQDLLIDITKDYINRLLRQNNDIVACYLTGSVLGDQALLVAAPISIWLLFIRKTHPLPAKFDALKAIFRWILFITINRFTPFIAECDRTAGWVMPLRNHDGIIYDTDHWLEYIQAGVDAQFDSPENTHARALKFADDARRYWFALDDDDETPFSDWLDLFFQVC